MKYFDADGNEIFNPDLALGYLTEKEVINHEAVQEVSHEERLTLPTGFVITYKVVDTPAKEAWKEIVSYTYTPYPVPEADTRPSQLDVVEAQATYTAMMTNTLLEGNTNV